MRYPKTHQIERQSVQTRMRWGIRSGIGISLIYVAFATLQFLFNARVRERHGDTLLAIVCVYLVGGSLGGALVGASLPFIRSRTACGIVGFMVVLPMAILFHYVWSTNADWTPYRVATVIFGSLFIGAPLGVSVGEQHLTRAAPERKNE